MTTRKFDKDISFEEWADLIENSADGSEFYDISFRLLNLYEEFRRRCDPKYKTGGGITG